MKLFDEIEQRGMIEGITSDELKEKINQGGMTFYVGYDPTGDSLHVGHLVMLNLMGILQKGGHTPIGVAGGGTGMIGDPGGRSKERNLLSQGEIEYNISKIKVQLERFLDFKEGNKAILVNNYDWLSKQNMIDFLRDIGKHFSVNAMVNRDSVKTRLEREGEGISYTEFSYMLLQAFDFYTLNEEQGCTLQLGGSDQWGNIVSGIDLTRRLNGNQLYGMTMPLITKADGTKFGKSESGAVWLSAEKTSPYEFYQFFLRQSDDDVIRFLKVFTDLDLSEIEALRESVVKEPHKRLAQKILAEKTTERVHGREATQKAIKASQVLFGEKIEDLDDQIIAQIFKDVPSHKKTKSDLETGYSLVDALTETKACPSKGQARKLVQAGGVYINNEQNKDPEYILTSADLASPSFLILRTGKKNYKLIQVD